MQISYLFFEKNVVLRGIFGNQINFSKIKISIYHTQKEI